jgi:hypothetical protein
MAKKKSKKKRKPPVVKWGKSTDGCVKSSCGRFEIMPDHVREDRKSYEGFILVDKIEDERSEYRTQGLCKDYAASKVRSEKVKAENARKKAEEAAKSEEPAPKPHPVEKTRKVTKDGFEYIERVWAEDGVVKVETQEGKLVNMTVRDAAIRASQINAMPLPQWHVERRNELVRQIVAACREAKYQMENPKDARAAAMGNLLNGLAPDGRTLEQLKKDQPILVQEAMKLQPAFVHMSLEDIVAVLKETQMGDEAKKRVLAEEDWARAQAKLASGLSG